LVDIETLLVVSRLDGAAYPDSAIIFFLILSPFSWLYSPIYSRKCAFSAYHPSVEI